MQCWENARTSEKNQFHAISTIFNSSPQLLRFLFDTSSPRLNSTPEQLLKAARGFSSSDYILIKLAIDIWCSEGKIQVHELFELERDLFNDVLVALAQLNY